MMRRPPQTSKVTVKTVYSRMFAPSILSQSGRLAYAVGGLD